MHGLDSGGYQGAPFERAWRRARPDRGHVGSRLDQAAHHAKRARRPARRWRGGAMKPSDVLRPRRKFDVFARRAAGDPLVMIGTIYAPDLDLARVYAFTTYNEDPWYELRLAPHDAFVTVSQDEVLQVGDHDP